MIADSRNAPFIINQLEEEIMDIPKTDGDILMLEQAI
jgi:hypothetical protein